MQKQLQAYVMCVCESCCSEHVSIMLMVSILACASPNEPWQQLQACFRNVTSNPPLLKLTFHAVLAACLDAATPDSWRLLAHYAGCCQPVHHPGGTPNSCYCTIHVTIWATTQQLLPPSLPSILPPSLPSILPPNSCYHPCYYLSYHPSCYHPSCYHPDCHLCTLVEQPAVVTTPVTVWATTQHL